MNILYARKINDIIVYPYVLNDLRKENPELSLPENLNLIASVYGVFEVVQTDKPQIDELTQALSEAVPVFMGDHFRQAWTVIEKFDAAEKQKVILDRAKQEKLSSIDFQWFTALQTGWDCGQGHLGMSAEDVALLTGNFALAKESAAMGGPIPPLVTKENNIITFDSIQDLTMMMLSYGQARSLLSIEYAKKRKTVQGATTIQELEAIN